MKGFKKINRIRVRLLFGFCLLTLTIGCHRLSTSDDAHFNTAARKLAKQKLMHHCDTVYMTVDMLGASVWFYNAKGQAVVYRKKGYYGFWNKKILHNQAEVSMTKRILSRNIQFHREKSLLYQDSDYARQIPCYEEFVSEDGIKSLEVHVFRDVLILSSHHKGFALKMACSDKFNLGLDTLTSLFMGY